MADYERWCPTVIDPPADSMAARILLVGYEEKKEKTRREREGHSSQFSLGFLLLIRVLLLAPSLNKGFLLGCLMLNAAPSPRT